MKLMPSCIAPRTVGRRQICPSITTEPASAGKIPAKIRISVLLPAPFSPTTATTSPRSSSSETSSKARTPGKLFETPSTRNKLLELAIDSSPLASF